MRRDEVVQASRGCVPWAVVALLIAASASTARAQAPPVGPALQAQERIAEAANANFNGNNWQVDLIENSVSFYGTLVIIGVCVVVLSVACGIVVRCRATTDPYKLAQRDPWMKAHCQELITDNRVPVALTDDGVTAPAPDGPPRDQ